MAVCRDRFADGGIFVPLSSLGRPELLAQTLAHATGTPAEGSRTIEEALVAHLRNRQLLLGLDNVEHLLPAAPMLADVVAACPQLVLLVTSRAILHVRGEQALPIRPLLVPDPNAPPVVETLMETPAVALFVDRAQAVRPGFALRPENAPDVVAICRELDGLPLAIELAAARIRLLPPHVLLTRLERRLHTLVGGPRDLPERHQTLGDAIAWSYDLLGSDEQTLLRRLSVFAGGATLDALSAVCGPGDTQEALEYLTGLVDHSLLRIETPVDEEPRFCMWETVREYALEQLEASGEREISEQAHAAYYLSLAERAEPEVRGPEQARWMELLEAEIDNLRAALLWGQTHDQRETGLRLAGSLWYFWFARGCLREGRSWLEGLLEQAGTAGRAAISPAVWAGALNGAAWLAYVQTDYDRVVPSAEESLALSRELGDSAGLCSPLTSLGCVALDRGDYTRATPLLEESLTHARAAANTWWTAVSLINLGLLDGLKGDLERARERLEESLVVGRASGDARNIAYALDNLGTFAISQGDLPRAQTLLAESLPLHRDLRDTTGAAEGLEDMAWIAVARGEPRQAARLLGAAEALRDASGAARPEYLLALVDRTTTAAREALGMEEYEAAWAEGGALSWEQAIEAALAFGA
jgi:predicted ATPase